MTDQITTIMDMYRRAYPRDGSYPTLGGLFREFRKADDPVIQSTTGYTNPIYGMPTTNFLNMKTDIWKLFKKEPWPEKSGWRIKTTDPTNFAGKAETGTIVDSDKPAYELMKCKPKIMQSRWDDSLLASLYQNIDDTIPYEQVAKDMGEYHAKRIDYYLGLNYDANASGNTQGTYVIESIDRLIGDEGEATTIYHDATSANIYNLAYHRSGGNTTYDAYVDHNSDTDRALSLTLIDDMYENARTYGADMERLVFLTGVDTYEDFNALLEGKQRITDVPTKAKISVNGLESMGSIDAGFAVGTYRGIPVMSASQHIAADTKSHLYLIDLDTVSIWMAMPTVLLATTKEDFLAVDYLLTKHLHLTACECVMKSFATNGKIINLS